MGHVYFAPQWVNFGTNGCAGGTYCAHHPELRCLYPGAHSFGSARQLEWEGGGEGEEDEADEEEGGEGAMGGGAGGGRREGAMGGGAGGGRR